MRRFRPDDAHQIAGELARRAKTADSIADNLVCTTPVVNETTEVLEAVRAALSLTRPLYEALVRLEARLEDLAGARSEVDV